MIIQMTNEKWQNLLCYKGFYDFVKDVKEYKCSKKVKGTVSERFHSLIIKDVLEFPNYKSYAALIEEMDDKQDWAELKAIVYAFLDMQKFIKEYLSGKTSADIQSNFINLFSCNKLNKPKTKKIKEEGKEKEIEINE